MNALAPARQADSVARLRSTLLVSHVSDALASSVQAVALPLLAFGVTGRLSQAAVVMVATTLPSVLLGAFAGPVADRLDRKALAVRANVAQGALLVAAPLLFSRGGLPAFLVVSFLAGASGAFARPAAMAALPSLLGDGYQQFMASRGGLMFLAQTLGPSVAAGVATFASPTSAVALAGALNLLAAAALSTVRDFDRTRAERAGAVSGRRIGRLLGEGMRYTRGNRVVGGMLAYWFVALAAVPLTTLPMLQYVTEDLQLPYLWFGVATSVYAAGCVVSSFASARLGRGISKRSWMAISGIGYGLVNLAVGAEPGFVVILLLWLVWGLLYGPEEVLGQVLFAEAVDEQMRGRVYSFMSIVFAVASAVGYVATGWAVDAVGPVRTIVLGGCLFVVAATFTFLLGPTAAAIRDHEARAPSSRD